LARDKGGGDVAVDKTVVGASSGAVLAESERRIAVTLSDSGQLQGERRAIQRDWLGHGLQLLGIVVVLGLPLIFWGVSISTTVATMVAHVDRQDKDISDQRQVQTILTGQLLDVAKQLTRIDTQLSNIRDDQLQKRR
jgi:hypothetical protein